MATPLPLLVPLSALFLAYGALVGAGQLPEHTGLTVVTTWLLPAIVLLWARFESLKTGRHVPGVGSGILLLLFGPFLVLYYLLRSWRERHWGLSVLLAGATFAPLIGYLGGQLVLQVYPIPPRYVEVGRGGGYQRVTQDLATQTARRDFDRLAQFLAEETSSSGSLPVDVDELYARWYDRRPQEEAPVDLFTGRGYYYERRDQGYGLWSAGPDHAFDTDDDLWFVWPPSPTTLR